MKKHINNIIIMVILLVFSSCDLNLELQDNPNVTTPALADITLLLPSVETQFVSLFNGFNGRTMNYTRMQYQFGDYTSGASDFDYPWSVYYAGILPDCKVIYELAEEKNLPKYAGVTKIIEAYSTVMMVDMFGDIPYTEAVQGTDIANPENDKDSDIYNAMFSLIDEAIDDLNMEDSPSIETDYDFLYQGNVNKWIKLANTLKLKMFLQTRLYDEVASKNGINALLSENNLINSATDDFQFKYGTNISAPDTRHPYYSSNYNSAGVGNYMSNSYMYALKNNNDPRLRYYFYRQTNTAPSGSDLVCTLPTPDSAPEYYCYIEDFYWGRDHAIKAGIPGDTQKRTTWGLYPAGGAFDYDQHLPANDGNGAGGAGIAPFMLSSFVNFMKAEAVLTIPGVNGDVANLFETAITHSINKVKSFGSKPGVTLGGMQPSSTDINSFITDRVNEFTTSGSNEKLELIMNQYWIALRGNGIEAYNNYRRTGKPYLQSPLSSGTTFPRVNFYPAAHINLNSNANQHSVTEQVFWDTNPSNFID